MKKVAQVAAHVGIWLCSAVVAIDWLCSRTAQFPYGVWTTAALLCVQAVLCAKFAVDLSRFLLAFQTVCLVEILFGVSDHVFSIGVGIGLGLWQFLVALDAKMYHPYIHLLLPGGTCVLALSLGGQISPLSFVFPIAVLYTSLFEEKLSARQGCLIKVVVMIALFPYAYLAGLLDHRIPLLGEGIGAASATIQYGEVGKLFLLTILLVVVSAYYLLWRDGDSDENIRAVRVVSISVVATIGVASYLRVDSLLDFADFILCPLLLSTAVRRGSAELTHHPDQKRYQSNLRLVATACIVILLAVGTFIGMQKLRSADQQVREWLARRDTHSASYVPFDEIPPDLIRATVAMEDRGFYWHSGLEPGAIHRAIRVNLRAKDVKQGGSTITQQLAKNIFLTKDRTVARKFDELFLALALEQQLTKDEILCEYMNCISYGAEAVGIQAAARRYFHKEPNTLKLYESIILVSLVPYDPKSDVAVNLALINRDVAASRIYARWGDSYTSTELQRAANIPVWMAVYPNKAAWDRGASEVVEATVQGVEMFSYVDKDEPRPIYFVNPHLKEKIEQFCRVAHERFGISGLDHLGVFNDRLVRGSDSALSSHAYGQALDISGFRFVDGTTLTIKELSEGKSESRSEEMIRYLKTVFDVYIDWKVDPERHSDHIHVEVLADRKTLPREPVY